MNASEGYAEDRIALTLYRGEGMGETAPGGMHTPGAMPGHDSRITINRTSVMSSMAQRTPSRPMPESFTPP